MDLLLTNTIGKAEVALRGILPGSGKYEQCRMFSALNTKNRERLVRGKGLCLNCFRKHMRKYCKEKMVCSVDGCTKTHHYLLHGIGTDIDSRNNQSGTKPTSVEVDESEPAVTQGARNGVSSKRLASQKRVVQQIIPVVLYGPNGRKKTTAMLDTGSNATLIQQDLAQKLGFSGQIKPMLLGGANTDDTVQSFTVNNLWHWQTSMEVQD